MTIDKPSLAALLSQSRGEKVDAKDSTRPFVLKDPKSIVKELLKKAKPEVPAVDEDDEYLKGLLAERTEPVDEPEEFIFGDLTEEKPDTKDILKKIMGKL